MTPTGQPDPEGAPASLGELGLCLWRGRWRLAACAAGGLVLALLFGALSKPTFRAQATILIEQQEGSGLLSDLAMLASLASAPATASELSVLESRTLAEQVLADGKDTEGRWNPHDERNLGLATLVEDEGLAPLALLRRRFLEPRTPDVPLVLPPRGLLARARMQTAEAPARVRLEFLGAGRVRLARAGLLPALRLGARDVEEHAFTPRTPLVYQGLALELEPWGDFEGARFVLEALPRHEALRRFQERLAVRETALNSGVIEVALADSDPRRAARTVNALCTLYLDSLAARGRRRASQTVEYVQGLLDEEAARFERNQETILRLELAHPELIAPESAASSLIEQMAALAVEGVQIELSQLTFGEIVAALEAGDRDALARIDGSLNVGVLVDPLTSGLLTELARLDAQASTLASDLLENHPLLAQNRAATETLLARTRAQLESRLAGLGSRRSELERLQAALRQRLGEMPEGLRELAAARVELGIHHELVPYLVRSLQGAEITRASAETRAELVDPAVAPDELSAPDLVRLAAFGVLLGLALGTLGAFLREPARGRVHRASELEQALATEGVVTLARLAPRTLVFRSARASPAAEDLRRLRGRLRFAPDGHARQRLGVAALGGEGEAATLAAELALAFESEGRRTLLVEAGPASAPAGACFGLAPAPGLAAHLAEGLPWEPLVRPTADGPAVLSWGAPETPAGDLLAREAAARFLEEAAARYDVLVVALPPAELLLAAPAFVRALDALCLVHRARSLPRARVRAAAAGLRSAGVHTLAGVLVERRA